jgi:MFS family permease
MMNDSTPRKFGPVRLVQGVTITNMITYYMATVMAMFLMTFVPQFQPFLLADFLKIPESQQGVLTGNVAFVAELVILVSIGGWGTLSDKTGRRFVFSMGFLVMAFALFLYPRADSIPALFLYRGLFALGAAAATTMVATVIADYVVNDDRGKASGLQGIGNGIGAVLTVVVALQLPKLLVARGLTPISAGQLVYWIMAGVGVLSVVILGVGLQNRTQTQKEQRKSILQISREGLTAAKDPGIVLAYMAAFISRGDMAIVGTFLTLWIVTYGTAVAGLSAAEALSRAGMVIGISQMVALITAPVFGMLADRMNRATATILAVALASIAYGSTLLVKNPMDPIIFLVAVLIGMGEMSGMIASSVLIAQHAKSEIRGSVIGIFSFCGAIGIMVATGLGGQLFDHWLPQGPFVLFSVFGLVVVAIGLFLRKRIVR